MSKRKKPHPGTTGPNGRTMSLDALEELRKLCNPRQRKPSPPAFDLEAARRKVKRNMYTSAHNWYRDGYNACLRWVLSEVLTRKENK